MASYRKYKKERKRLGLSFAWKKAFNKKKVALTNIPEFSFMVVDAFDELKRSGALVEECMKDFYDAARWCYSMVK